MSISDLVHPTGIAVVGASDDRYYARSVLANLIAGGFDQDKIYPVHPTRATAAGIPCVPSLADIKGPVSLVIVVTRADVVPEVIVEAGGLGIRSAVVFADGFAEVGEEGRRRQDELARIAQTAGVTIMGPNTLGFLAPPEGTLAWASGDIKTTLRAGGIGFVFQSSGMMNLILGVAQQRFLGVRAAFSVGNEVGFDAADFIEYLADDPQTNVIGAMIEGATRPRRLIEALERAREVGKPVVMLKLGRSERARRNAVAHTGRMVSSGRAWDADLRRLGVVQVRDLDELINAVSLFEFHASSPLMREDDIPGVALLTISGGDCGLLSDLCEDSGVPLAELTPETHGELVQIFGKPDLLGNPLDVENIHKTDPPSFERALGALAEDPGVALIAVRMNLPVEPTNSSKELYREIANRVHEAGKLFVVMSRANESLSNDWYLFFVELGVPFLPAYGPALRVISMLTSWWTESRRWTRIDVSSIPESSAAVEDSRVASWQETQDLLNEAGVPYSPAGLAQDRDGALKLADEIGYPVAVKMVSTALPHKSDVGGVVLNVRDEAGLSSAVDDLYREAGVLGVQLDGVEVQAMAKGGLELIVGVTRDASLGPMIMVGIGGVFTEIASDVAMSSPPLEEQDCAALLQHLQGAPLLYGARGKPAVDVAALCSLLGSLSRYASREDSQLIELECNPIMVGGVGEGVVAVDALATLRE